MTPSPVTLLWVRQDASIENIQHAARIANAYNFIQRKKKNLIRTFGDRGTKLSGGERQRLTIARAILKTRQY
jgi:subfamily B ATP-binding cassette protein MsbA